MLMIVTLAIHLLRNLRIVTLDVMFLLVVIAPIFLIVSIGVEYENHYLGIDLLCG